MSWMDRAKVMASQAAEATKKAVDAAVVSTKKTYEELKAPPSHIQCSGCPNQVEVPANLFDWTCPNSHINGREATVCAQCSAPKPKPVTDPTVVCSSCHAATPVPSTNATKHLKEGAHNAKVFAAKTSTAAKEQIKYLSSNPETFHCAHCNSLLAVPTGPWACQTCTAENPEDAQKCSKCTQKKSEQKAICGVCRQSTVIPTSNFIDGLKATTRDLAKSGSKIYYDARSLPYVSCQRCGHHVPLPADANAPAGAAGATAAVPPPAGAPPAGAPPAGAPQGEGSSPTPSQNAAIKELVCPACKNKVQE